MGRLLVALTFIALVACGQPQASSTSPQPGQQRTSTPSNTSSAPPTVAATPSSALFVVLEARGANSTFGGGPDAYDAHDTVAIVGVDGYAKARATFKPRALPAIGMAGTLMQPEARVAAGAVFYIDGDGTVRRLDQSGKVTPVASFPAGQPQQEISFALSPDGNHFISSVLTLPAKNPNYGPGSPGSGGPWVAGAHGYVELFSADAGGSARSLARTDLGSGDAGLAPAMRVVGWDQTGPLVTLQSNLGSQQGSLGNSFEGCCMAHLDASGHAGPPLTAADCFAWQEGQDGSFLCGAQNYTSLWLIDKSGHTLVTVPTPGQAVFLALSPDAAWVAAQGHVWSLRGAPTLALPGTFYPEGWLDDSTIIGYQDTGVGASVGNMALVHVSNPGQLVDLGFKGIFVSNF